MRFVMARFVVDNRVRPVDFGGNRDPVKRVLQNCKNLLMCRMGEVPYDRLRGLNPALFDLSIPEMNEQLMPEIDRVFSWEPNAEAVSAVAELDANGDTVITVVVDVVA